MLKDAYTGEDVPANSTSDLDHVMTAKEIHDDRGRSLAGLKGTDLANSDENLQATNRHTNRTKKADDMGDIYVFMPRKQMEYLPKKKNNTYNNTVLKNLMNVYGEVTRLLFESVSVK